MDEELRRDLDRYAAEKEEMIFRDLARLVAINSVEGEPAPGAPFGAGPRAALDLGLAIARELGLEAVDCEGRIGYAALGRGDRYLATITHLDVVPAGDGWQEDPFTLREREGYVIGRGVMDDKGPSVLCLYALNYLRERGVPLRYPIRALLGVNTILPMSPRRCSASARTPTSPSATGRRGFATGESSPAARLTALWKSGAARQRM